MNDPSPHTSREQVLVVDDDEFVGRAIQRVLSRYDVTVARSAASALARIEAGASFVAVLCDLFMPGMTGLAFYDGVAAIDPRIARRILFISGAVAGPELQEAALRTGSPCVPKPFDHNDLRSAVDAVARR